MSIFNIFLAYWVVASIRYELKQKGMNKTWSQILDIMSTQKSIASEMENLQDEEIHTQQCSVRKLNNPLTAMWVNIVYYRLYSKHA